MSTGVVLSNGRVSLRIYAPDHTGETPLAWQDDALCAQTDPEVFFPEKGGSTRDAKGVCLSCDVRLQCLAYALERRQRGGIWGGLSDRQRRKLEKPEAA